jgi:hypothetical protein
MGAQGHNAPSRPTRSEAMMHISMIRIILKYLV